MRKVNRIAKGIEEKMEKKLPPPYSIKDPLLNSEMCPSYLPPPSQEMCDTIAYPPPDLGMYIPRAYPSPSAPPSLPQPVHQHVEMPTQQTKQLVIITLPESPAIYGPSPISTRCPRCRNLITTAVRTKPTIKTHLFALLLCALGCWLCCFFPYCIDSCQSKSTSVQSAKHIWQNLSCKLKHERSYLNTLKGIIVTALGNIE